MRIVSGNKGGLIKVWDDGVIIEEEAWKQLHNVASLPFIGSHIAVMPDAHWGNGSTVGSVIPTRKAIIPAAVGVDLGCGMMAIQTSLKASDLPDNLHEMRCEIEKAVPHGRTDNGGLRDRGAWYNLKDENISLFNASLASDLERIISKAPELTKAARRAVHHLGTLGTGNHFIEICLDENQDVWIMLHSGSRGIGNSIGSHYIQKAKKDMERWFINLPDKELAYIPEGASYFHDYMNAVRWAQSFAFLNREVMMRAVINSIKNIINIPFLHDIKAINCHHNYIYQEKFNNENLYITRKGAIRVKPDIMGIIPGSMGAKSFIVRGTQSEEAKETFFSCSHGAGRAMSRNQAKKIFTLQDHEAATEGVECRKDADVIDETPAAYKDIHAVMMAQKNNVEIVHTLKQVLCVKG